MSEEFDPYYKWLGIPPNDQPPNHYRLLGLEPFESEPDVIEAAFQRQMAYVRTYQLGPHSELSQKILNEIAAAKVCLLDPEKRAAYDEELRGWLGAGAAAESAAGRGPRPVNAPTTESQVIEAPPAPAVPVVFAERQEDAHRARRRWPVFAALGTTALLLAVLLALSLSPPNAQLDAGAAPEPAGDGSTSGDSQDSGGVATLLPPPSPPPSPALQVPPGARLILTFEEDTLSSKDGRPEIRDASGNGHVAVLSAGQIVSGKIGNALCLDDGDDIKIAGTFPSGAAPRSLAAWVRADPKGFRRRFQCVAFYGFARVEGVFGIATAKGKWCFFAWGTGYDLPTRVSVDEQWHHHAVTYDGKNILYYYDAEIVLQTLPRSKRRLNTAAGPAAPGAPKVTFAGCVDEFAVFDRVLEEHEVRTLFEMGKLGQPLQTSLSAYSEQRHDGEVLVDAACREDDNQFVD